MQRGSKLQYLETERQLKSLESDLPGERNHLAEATAAVHTTGAVATAARQVLCIVPETGGFAVDAVVENRDRGFVEPAQAAVIKATTFALTRHRLRAPILPSRCAMVSTITIRRKIAAAPRMNTIASVRRGPAKSAPGAARRCSPPPFAIRSDTP